MEERQNQAWMFIGKPEFVDVNAAPMPSTEGGYVIAMELTAGGFRLAATRQPGKYVSTWRHNVRRYGIPDITRVLVSHPHLRYEATKRGLAALLAEYRDVKSETFRVSIETLNEMAQKLWVAMVVDPSLTKDRFNR